MFFDFSINSFYSVAHLSSSFKINASIISPTLISLNPAKPIPHSYPAATSFASSLLRFNTGNAVIVGFNVRPEPKARLLAEKNGVDIKIYRVIYDAIDDIQKALKGMLAPVFREEELGHAEVRETFNITASTEP